ncbi:DUF3318 domain-containing protein [Dolichospermum circinale CS-1225]|uniref:DUF3318 domain-containing protein n=1 Tax=Dolichospermum circinale CS-537/01 TaxID=3021739 RepID=A0ABT5A661_9CYAN|nr:DUF3318 domain-containing protein [Dolichospermum circinale]MDB9457307.1 DUF3318 domain-containing protein [Dolichospermum circinale CS-545/17]MDB9468929.1 DUF3318 domain-containing protein [Dolichospermum circinale CS-539/09]MDB9469392.1 DUF3318 domain-containing protein [Dolichospermum circinale CS-539]MDB9487426.1 DUF3318 domain-containing protein [Dolichospermum circinale CS-537/01]MDB9489948.1 DUF3318 domain-containing protein [Dolichospermum circinale CS-534/05]
MESNIEIRRLLDVMPASGRMMTKILSKPEQKQVIDAAFPLPLSQSRQIYINFDLWRRLTKPQRDLLLLQMVCWLTGVKWLQPNIYQGVVLAGFMGGIVEAVQSDVVGMVISGGLTALAAIQIWRMNRSQESKLNADIAAIRIAQRRGYSETEAAEHLLTAIETVAKIEERSGLNFSELIRCQNLKVIAGLSPVGMPKNYQ